MTARRKVTDADGKVLEDIEVKLTKEAEKKDAKKQAPKQKKSPRKRTKKES